MQELTSGGVGGWWGKRVTFIQQLITRQHDNDDNYDIVKLLQAMKMVCGSFSARRIVLVSIAPMPFTGHLVELLGLHTVDIWNLNKSLVVACLKMRSMALAKMKGERRLRLRSVECSRALCF